MKRYGWLLFLLSLTFTGFAQETPLAPYTIFSNLGPQNDRYDGSMAFVVSGPDCCGGGSYQWMAVPFTPLVNAAVIKIRIAIGHNTGANGITLSLNLDNAGVPGTAIYSWKLRNLYAYGGCCLLDVATNQQGLQVSQGVQYWVVASTSLGPRDAYDAWNTVYDHSQGACAYNLNETGWVPACSQPPAFGVFGKQTD
jgi:hypothetical protein